MHQHWEWGTMTAAISHLGHDMSTDVAGWLLVVSYIRICRVLYQVIGDTLRTRWGWASSSASKPSAQKPPHQIGCCVMLSRQQHHWGMMRGGGGGKIGGGRAGGYDSYNRRVCTSVNHGGYNCPSIQQSANILCDRTVLLKLEKYHL